MKRLYIVGEQGRLLKERIVEADTQAQAIRIVVGERFYARVATAKDVQKIMAEQFEGEKTSLANVEITSKEGR